MNLFKKNPKRLFEIIAATFLVLLAYYLVVYFTGIGVKTPQSTKITTLPTVEKREEQPIDYDSFGVVHIEVDSPSYAKSNFDVNPTTTVTVYFNEAVDLQDVLGKFRLIDKVTGESVPVEMTSELRAPSDTADSYTKKWQEVWQQKVILSPAPELEPVTMYVVEIESGYYNELRTGTSGSNFRFEFLTADEPGILSTNLDNHDYEMKSSESVKVIFKSPMREEDLSAKVQLLPLTNFTLQVNDKIMTISTPLEVGSYQLVIPANTMDIYERSLGDDFVVDFDVI